MWAALKRICKCLFVFSVTVKMRGGRRKQVVKKKQGKVVPRFLSPLIDWIKLILTEAELDLGGQKQRVRERTVMSSVRALKE